MVILASLLTEEGDEEEMDELNVKLDRLTAAFEQLQANQRPEQQDRKPNNNDDDED